MDYETRWSYQSRKGNYSLCYTGLDKDSFKNKIEKQWWQLKDFHPPEIYLETVLVPEKKVWYSSLYAHDLHKWTNKRLLVPIRLCPDYLDLIQYKKLQRPLHTSHKWCNPEKLFWLWKIWERKQNFIRIVSEILIKKLWQSI